MPKIILPEKVKCWKCEKGFLPAEPDKEYPEGVIPLCDCEDGYRYDFDDLAAAVTGAGYECSFYGSDKDGYKASLANPKAASVNELIVSVGKGLIPTAALLNAIKKVNEEADGNG